MSSPMRPLMRLGHRPHLVDRRKYGQPYLGLYWAGRRFAKPGLYAVLGNRQFRVLAARRTAKPMANEVPGFDPYVVRELTTDEARRTSFRGTFNPPTDSDVGSDPLANIRAGVDYADRTYGSPTT